MNLAFRTRHLARVFVDAANAIVTLESASELARRISSPAFTATPVFEQRPDGSTRMRIVFVNDEGWQLSLMGESFDLVLLPTIASNGDNVGDVAGFADVGARVLAAALDHVGRDAHRIALVEEGLVAPMPSERMQALGMQLLNCPAGLESNVFEWDWRICRREFFELAGTQEPINCVTIVRRAPIEFNTGRVREDRVFASVDVNTWPDNSRARFKPGGLAEFFSKAVRKNAEVGRTMDKLVGGIP